MNIILFFGILLIVVGFFLRRDLPPYWGLLIVFLIMGFQEGVQGDFMTYKSEYEQIASRPNFQQAKANEEPVWNFIYHFFAPFLPFWAFVIIMSAFQCYVLWKVGNRYGSREYGFVGPILFFFTSMMMVVQMKALRQGLAIEMCVLAYYMATEKRAIAWSSFWAILAVLIHNSSIIVAPVIIVQYFLGKRKDMDAKFPNVNKSHKIAFPLAVLALYLFVYSLKLTSFSDLLNQLATFVDSSDSRLTHYFTDDQAYTYDQSWKLIFYDGVMVFLCAWFYQRANLRYRILAIVSIISCFGDMLFYGVGTLPRMIMYYYVFTIFVYPMLVEMISKKYGVIAATILVVFLMGYAMNTSLLLMTDPTGDRFGNYHFVFLK